MFGNNVKDSTLFDNISTSTGAIIGDDGHYSNVVLMQRGLMHIFLWVMLFILKKHNLSGIYILKDLVICNIKYTLTLKIRNSSA